MSTKTMNGGAPAKLNGAKVAPKEDAPEHENTWNTLVYKKGITSTEVLDVYKSWAGKYHEDMAKVNPKKSEHVAKFLHDMVTAVGRNPADVTVLDVAAGTGTVGIELKNYGFKNIVATDYCEEMLDVAGKKGCYKELICCKFGSTIPKMLKSRKFDCVVMHGGFAAGHLPLTSLHTMSRLCKPGGFMINSMSLQYTYFVEEYENIHDYVAELQESGVWRLEFTKVIENVMSDRHALVHGMHVL